MKLQAEQLRAIAQGIDRITEEANGFRFHRFTAEQEALYRESSPNDFYVKAGATSGVNLAFRTDSRMLTVAVSNSRGSSRPFGFVDLEVDGEFRAHIGSAENGIGLFGGSVDLGEGMKTVRLYFPQLVASELRELSLDDGAVVEPTAASRRMLIFGDSITQGYDAKYPSHCYAMRLARLLDADARNKGIGGEKFFPELASARDPGADPELITVAYGTNDWSSREPDHLEAQLRAFYCNLSAAYPTSKIFALSPIWRGNWRQPKPFARPFSWVADLIAQVANGLPNVVHVPGIDLVPHDPTCFSPDVLHPNDIGFATYAERLYTAMKG